MADLSMLGGTEDDHAELKKLNAEVVSIHGLLDSSFILTRITKYIV